MTDEKEQIELEITSLPPAREPNLHPCPICQDIHDVCIECGGSRICNPCRNKILKVAYLPSNDGKVYKWLLKKFKEYWKDDETAQRVERRRERAIKQGGSSG